MITIKQKPLDTPSRNFLLHDVNASSLFHKLRRVKKVTMLEVVITCVWQRNGSDDRIGNIGFNLLIIIFLGYSLKTSIFYSLHASTCHADQKNCGSQLTSPSKAELII